MKSGVIFIDSVFLSKFLAFVYHISQFHRYKWGSFICPMSYYLSGNFFNEFSGNSEATGINSFNEVADFYGFHIEKWDAFVALLSIGLIYRVLWLILLKSVDMARKREVMVRVGEARKRAKLIVAAGLRWTTSRASSSTNNSNIDDDAYAELEFGTTMMSGNSVVSSMHSGSNKFSFSNSANSTGSASSLSSVGSAAGSPPPSISLAAQRTLSDSSNANSLTPPVSSFSTPQSQANANGGGGLGTNMYSMDNSPGLVTSPIFPSPFLSRGTTPSVWSKPVRPQEVVEEEEPQIMPDFDDDGEEGTSDAFM